MCLFSKVFAQPMSDGAAVRRIKKCVPPYPCRGWARWADISGAAFEKASPEPPCETFGKRGGGCRRCHSDAERTDGRFALSPGCLFACAKSRALVQFRLRREGRHRGNCESASSFSRMIFSARASKIFQYFNNPDAGTNECAFWQSFVSLFQKRPYSRIPVPLPRRVLFMTMKME